MIGRRFPDGDWPNEPGGYAKARFTRPDGGKDVGWILMAPRRDKNNGCFIIGKPHKDGSPHHHVEENADGTITVRPNPPADPGNSNSIAAPNGWHGYIDQGVWREC